MRKVLIVGATSAIAAATARRFAAAGDALWLVARDGRRLEDLAQDLRVRGAPRVELSVADATDTGAMEDVVERAWESLEGVDVLLVAHGVLPDPDEAERDPRRALEAIDVNYASVVAVVLTAVPRFEGRGSGTIAVIGSVAGDRGRAGNYLYGSTKAAVDVFLEGLRARLATGGVHVLTVKPGFVDTPMIAHLKRGILWASPRTVARGIDRAIRRRRSVVYLPWFWRPILFVVRHLPAGLLRRLGI